MAWVLYKPLAVWRMEEKKGKNRNYSVEAKPLTQQGHQREREERE